MTSNIFTDIPVYSNGKMYLAYKRDDELMKRKSRVDFNSRTLELINKKVREINERRRGMKITSIEDELDRQELNNYMRLIGADKESISLESAHEDVSSKSNIFYATLFAEILIEILLVYFAVSIALRPSLTTLDYAMSGLLALMFLYLGYLIIKEVRK